MQPKDYQNRSLDALERFLKLAVRHGSKLAFIHETGRPYIAVRQLPELPYVCLRIPTGGGKTFMACEALGVVATAFLQADHAVVLWLVPSNAILDQTLAALRDRSHPYRQAIDTQFNGQVAVMNLAEALYVQRSELQGKTCVIISTLQAMRVEETDGRKVYESNGALQHHFTGLAPELEAQLERLDNGVIPYSLANVLRLWRPVVIIDEAHNARTPLSFDTLARFKPSCIVEFTATPETTTDPSKEQFASNILYHVSAAELKLAHMVKLPIKLETRSNWKLAIGDAIRIQRMLEQAAIQERKKTGEYIRPIVLLQAQPKSQTKTTLNVEVVRQALVEDFRIPEEQIKRATSEDYEIGGLDLFSPDCLVRFIITVAALKEGWDCAFAYVLCTVSEIGTSRSVEQILGRILRMPGTKEKQQDALNCAYAIAASQPFIQAASSLKDALIENGFQRLEADQLVSPMDEQRTFYDAGLLFPEFEQVIPEKPDLSKLPEDLRERVTYEEGTGTLVVATVISESDKAALEECFSTPEAKRAIEEIYHKSQGRKIKPCLPRPPIKVPMLAIRVNGQLELFEEDHFLGGDWKLSECDAALTEVEFPSVYVAGDAGEIDISDEGKLEIRHVEQVQQQLRFLTFEPGWDAIGLTNWLDRQIYHPDVLRVEATLFIHQALTELMESRGLAIDQLAQEKFRLCNALTDKIRKHREERRHTSYTQLVLPGTEWSADFEVDHNLCFELCEDQYAPNRYYNGSYRFKHHYFRGGIGDFDTGEECECAQFIDEMNEVQHWVRNLPRSECSFWLQTPVDKFHPDFVVQLKDGRILVVEYKGKHLWDSAKDDRLIGELWADRSKGRCVFVMVTEKKWSMITAAINKGR